MAVTFCKIRILNIIGKQLDSWLGSTKFAFWRKMNIKKNEEKDGNWIRGGLESNIALPSTGEEAMKRLLACKGKDPYSILGVTPTCSDDDIKKYYKRQAFLVHPDKNNQPGAEEAFKILVHAFDIIGEPVIKRLFYSTLVCKIYIHKLLSRVKVALQMFRSIVLSLFLVKCRTKMECCFKLFAALLRSQP